MGEAKRRDQMTKGTALLATVNLVQRAFRRVRRLSPRWLLPLAGLVVVIGMLALRLADPVALQVLRLKATDIYTELSPRTLEEDYTFPVLIVDIDDRSLEQHGQWPWPRTLIAELLDRLVQYGAVVIGVDMIFSEADRLSPAQIARFVEPIDPAAANRLRVQPSNEERLAETLKRSRIVLGQSGHKDIISSDDEMPMRSPSVAFIGGDPSRYLFGFDDMIRNLPVLEASAHGLGLISVVPEPDGLIRRVPALARVGDSIQPSLTLEMLRVATGEQSIAARSNEAGLESVIIQQMAIPVDRNGRIWLNLSETDARRYVSATDVLNGEVDRTRLAGRLVLLGTSATALSDIWVTPLHPAIPGVELHAQLLETILAQEHIVSPNYAIAAELLFVVVIGGLLIVLVPLIDAKWSVVLLVVSTAIVLMSTWYLYTYEKIVIDGIVPALSTLAIFLTLITLKYGIEERRRHQVRKVFSHYLSPVMVDRLAEDPAQVRLGGELRNMTIMFSDIRGFTTLSEGPLSDPQALTALLNEYLTAMTTAILEHNGTIDKYIGDAIMAFWNAPVADDTHVRDACLAALAMSRALDRLNAELTQREGPLQGLAQPLNFGVGINTGPCLVGNMGSRQRFNYSVIGDVVNVASRIEGQTKSFGVRILIGEDTAKQVADMALLEVDAIQLRGKSGTTRVYTLLGDESIARSEGFKELRRSHQQLLDAFAAGDAEAVERARAACKHLAEPFAITRLYQVYGERELALAGQRLEERV